MPAYLLGAPGTAVQHVGESTPPSTVPLSLTCIGTTWGAELPGYDAFTGLTLRVMNRPWDTSSLPACFDKLGAGYFCPLPSNSNARVTFAPTYWWEFQLYEEIFGNLFTQNIVASMSTFDATLIKKTSKAMAASMAAFDGTLIRQTNKTLSSSMALFNGSIVKQTNKILSASMSTFAGVLAEAIVFGKSLVASMSTFDAALAGLFIPFVPPSAGQTMRNWFRRAF